jgi:hypothetical protein
LPEGSVVRQPDGHYRGRGDEQRFATGGGHEPLSRSPHCTATICPLL